MPYQTTIELLLSNSEADSPSYRVLITQTDAWPTPEAALLRAKYTIEVLEENFSVHIRQIRVFEVRDQQED